MDVRITFSRQGVKHVNIGINLAVTKAISEALLYEGFEQTAHISVTFTDNEGIRALNKEYRDKDTATDVLSFPQYDFAAGETPDPDYPCELGDIVISLERAREQAKEIGHSFKKEVAFLSIHSVLHLLGYDHERSEKDEEDMCRRQREIVQRLNTRGQK